MALGPWEFRAQRCRQDELGDVVQRTVALKLRDQPANKSRRPKRGNRNRGHGKSRRRR